jgi:dTDP-4-amino-4,6-dideoxygalactose transaminase
MSLTEIQMKTRRIYDKQFKLDAVNLIYSTGKSASEVTHLGHRPGDFPVAEEVCERILSLPMHAYLTDEEIERVVRGLGIRE